MNSLTELKQVIEAMESSLEGDVVDQFQQQLSNIGNQYSKNAAVTSVVKMLQSIARYVASHKNNIHEQTLPVLNSIVVELERLLLEQGLSKQQMDQIQSKCIQHCKFLKTKIAFQPLLSTTEMENLKAVILAVDWEISDSTLQTFETVTSELLVQLKSHKIHHAFLKILHSMGGYVASKKAAAHQDSIVFLRSVFENFERIVHAPDMPFQEKKQLIENDIRAFKEFKEKLAAAKNDAASEIEDEVMPPALSHVKGSRSQNAQDVVPLNQVSGEPALSKVPADGVMPALSGKQKSMPQSRDVMGELFSLKESPADELLDAIHLSSIHGPDQETTMNEQSKEELQKKGIKNLTSLKKGGEPIPEIGSRLDKFFSLDSSEVSGVTGGGDLTPPEKVHLEEIQPEAVQPEEVKPDQTRPEPATEINRALPEPEIDDKAVKDPGEEVALPQENKEQEESIEDIFPFQETDEFSQGKLDGDFPTRAVTTRLKSLVKDHEGLLERKVLTAVEEDLLYLKPLWKDDSDKALLLEILFWLIRLLKKYPVPVSLGENTDGGKVKKTDSSESDSQKPSVPSSGLWGKIKPVFFSSNKK